MHVLLINVLWSNISDTIFFIIINMVYIVIKPTSFLSCYIINIIFIVFKKKIIIFIMLRSQQTMNQLWGQNSEKNIMSVGTTCMPGNCKACHVLTV